MGWSAPLREEYKQVRLMKESPRGSVRLIWHEATGKWFILRQFTGNAEVYRKLLGCTCPNLPNIFEAAELDGKNLVLEEYVEGDTLDFLLKGALFSPEETRKIVTQLCRALWVLHDLGAVRRDVKPDNVILRGTEACHREPVPARPFSDRESGFRKSAPSPILSTG